MDFLLIDLFKQKIQGQDFLVVVLYEQTNHVTSKVYFKYSEKSEERLEKFFQEYAYTIITPYIKYSMKSNGKIALQLSI